MGFGKGSWSSDQGPFFVARPGLLIPLNLMARRKYKPNLVKVTRADGTVETLKPKYFREGPKSASGKPRRPVRRGSRSDYRAYLRSEAWAELKQRYRASDLPQRCIVCGAHKVELHHRTYKRIGQERLTDLVPLCREHHQAEHDAKAERRAA